MLVLVYGNANDRKRQQLMSEQGGRCRYCGRMVGSGGKDLFPVLDHFLPVSRGGRRKDLVLACHWCDNVKGMMHGADFLALVLMLTVEADVPFNNARGIIKRKAKAANRALQERRQKLHPKTAQPVRPRQFTAMPSQRGI